MASRSLQWISEWMLNWKQLGYKGLWSGCLCLSSQNGCPFSGDWWSESWQPLRYGIRKAWITPSTNTPPLKVHKGKVDGLRLTPALQTDARVPFSFIHVVILKRVFLRNKITSLVCMLLIFSLHLHQSLIFQIKRLAADIAAARNVDKLVRLCQIQSGSDSDVELYE